MKLVNFVFALLFCATLFKVNAQDVTLLSPDEFETGLSKPGVQILDVRTSGEYQNGHIKSSLQADWTNPGQFKDRVQYLDKDKPVMVYCASGGRSSTAAKWMRDNGFNNVKELKGGITAWNANSKKIESDATVPQIQLQEYTSMLKGKNVVLVDFGAAWCPPCKKMEPVLSRLEKEDNTKFELVRIDGGIHTDLMKHLKVDALPTFIMYKNGQEFWRRQGVIDISEFKKQLTK